MCRDIPRPREATSVAIRMGALPLRNSVEFNQIKKCSTLRRKCLFWNVYFERLKAVKRKTWRKTNGTRERYSWLRCTLTNEHPVSFWLTLVSMNTHGWPPGEQSHIEATGLVLNAVTKYSKRYTITGGNFSPIAPHPPSKIITSFLSLHKDDGFVLLFSHYLLHQLKKSVKNRDTNF